MSESVCRAEFPLLYPQLEDNVKAWQAKGGISYKDLDDAVAGMQGHWGKARVVIRDGQLFIRRVHEGGESRLSALLHLLHTAVLSDPSTSSSDINSTGIELVLTTADKEGSHSDAAWVLNKRYKEDPARGRWLLPDFGFAGWPEAGIASFEEFTRLAQLQDQLIPWEQKGNKALWRGFLNSYPVRHDLMHRTDVTQHPGAGDWADVRETSFHDVGDKWAPIIPMHEHCRHKFLIQTEGNSYSGRGKFLWSCNSVVISHPLEWTQHFHPALNWDASSREQNMVQLPGPLFEGLEEVTRELQKLSHVPPQEDLVMVHGKFNETLGINPPQRIAENAVEALRRRYLTPAATACYFRAALKEYGKVLRKDTWPRDENAAAWDMGGVGIVPQGGPGGGVAPGGGQGKDLHQLGIKGDIEYGVWRLSGSPNWPPEPLPADAAALKA